MMLEMDHEGCTDVVRPTDLGNVTLDVTRL